MLPLANSLQACGTGMPRRRMSAVLSSSKTFDVGAETRSERRMQFLRMQ